MWLNACCLVLLIGYHLILNITACSLPHSGSILDSQLCWKSGKFQLARWRHERAVLCSWNHPPTQPPHQLEIHLGMSAKLKIWFFQCSVVSPPQMCPLIKRVCSVSPLPEDVFSVWCPSPKPNYCAIATLSSILDPIRSINLAQLVSPSVALIAELVVIIVVVDSRSLPLILGQQKFMLC